MTETLKREVETVKDKCRREFLNSVIEEQAAINTPEKEILFILKKTKELWNVGNKRNLMLI